MIFMNAVQTPKSNHFLFVIFDRLNELVNHHLVSFLLLTEQTYLTIASLSSDAVTTLAGMTFGILACSTDPHERSLCNQAIKCILRAMELNKTDMALQEVLCSGAANLSEDLDMCKILINEGAVPTILSALKTFPQSSKVIHSSLYFLENASKETGGKTFLSFMYIIVRIIKDLL